MGAVAALCMKYDKETMVAVPLGWVASGRIFKFPGNSVILIITKTYEIISFEIE